jgi:hypothetical protein
MLRGSSSLRLVGTLVALLIGGGLGGCGGEPGSGGGAPRFQLLVCEADGEPPTQGLTVERLEGRQLSNRPLVARPVPGQPRIFEVPGAPDGQYYLHLPDGWGHLFLNSLPRLEAGGQLARLRVGRPHTLYLDSHVRGRLLGDVWGARKPQSNGDPGPAVPVEMVRDPGGITLVRLPAAQWAGPTTLMGRFVDGGLTEMILTELKEHGRPVYKELEPEPVGPLRVSIASPQPLADDALWAHVVAEGLPIEDHQQQPVRGGSAFFRAVPAGGSGISVSLGEGPDVPRFRIGPAGWREEGEVRLHAPPSAPVAVQLPGVKAAPMLRIQARREDGDSYGLVPWVRAEAGDDVSVRLDLGRWRLLIDDGTNMRIRRLSVDGPGKVAVLDDPPPEPPAIVQGTLTMGEGRRLLWQREEDGRLVLGQGFVLRGGAGGRYRGRLPPGAYRLAVEDLNGVIGKPRRIVLTAGMQMSLPLDG